LTSPTLSRKRAQALIESFRNQPILVLGDLMLDVTISGVVERVSPEAPVPVVRVSKENATLGGAGNVVRNLAALGARALPLGVVGQDEAGRRICSLFKEQGLPIRGILESSTRPTTVKSRIVAGRQQMLRFDREIHTWLSGEDQRTLGKRVRSLWDGAQALILSDYDKGAISPGLLEDLLPEARKRGLIVAVDPKMRNFSGYQPVSVITPNRGEAARAMGRQVESDTEIEAAGRGIQEKLGHPLVVLTLGEAGIAVFEPDGPVTRIRTTAREVFDVSGAGDTVVAVLTAALAAGASPVESAALANAAGMVVVGKLGTAVARTEELLDALS
jgi:D-beta-D-heptose 7-phosphate kinase/D-beta-D-heptose 1-phosphate adenosyltransferase